MLVLSRKREEAIVLTGGIRVVVSEIRGDKVRLGIEAPPEVKVVREELLARPHHPAEHKLIQGGAASAACDGYLLDGEVHVVPRDVA